MGELFEVSRGNVSNKNLLNKNNKGVSFIAQNETDNGFVYKVEQKNNKLFKGNAIIVGRQTGIVYFQEKEFITTDGVLVLIAKNNFIKNRKIGFVLISSIKKQMQSFCYTNTVSAEKLNKITIQLPIKNNKIDFDFMDSFIAELEACHIAELEACHIAELEAYLLATGLNDYILSSEIGRAHV